MAGFYPHTGKTSPGGFVPLPTVFVTGVLDSLVADLGNGVNGWRLYDDCRSPTGTTYPIYPHLYHPYGTTNNVLYFYSTVGGRLFTSGNQQAQGHVANGYAWYTSISGFSGSRTPISVDLVTWYDAYYSSGYGVTTSDTATLDRNYQGVTGRPEQVYQKCTKYVVLESSSSTKTFYVQIAQMVERAGTPVLFVRPFETWNSATHTGTNGGSMEHVRFFADATTNLAAKAQYIVWYLSGVFCLWTRGAYEGYETSRWNPNVGTACENFMYLGLLDTSGCYDNDADAVVWITGDTTYSGMHAAPNLPLFNQSGSAATIAYAMYSPVQCMRTVTGTLLWGAPTSYGFAGMNPLNQYHVWPRGRWYAFDTFQGQTDSQGKSYLRELDLWHAGSPNLPGVNEGRRGRLQYVKVPDTSANNMSLMSLGPANDGYSYIVLKTSTGFTTSGYSTVNASFAPQMQTVGGTQWMASGWAFSAKSGLCGLSGSEGPGDTQSSDLVSSQGNVLTLIAMPII
jgi:hypothetical protein